MGLRTSSLPAKTCFVVAEFGKTGEEQARATQVLKHLVRKVLDPLNFKVVRADEIHESGLITHQIIRHLLDDELVVADLTGHNPNVFYEIAVRHAARKPIIHMLTDGATIPFDLKDVRTVFYALDDPDRLEEAQRDLDAKVRAIDVAKPEDSTPLGAVRNLRVLEQSADPATRAIGQVLEEISQIRVYLRGREEASQRAQAIKEQAAAI